MESSLLRKDSWKNYLDIINGKVWFLRFIDASEECDIELELVIFASLVAECPPGIFTGAEKIIEQIN